MPSAGNLAHGFRILVQVQAAVSDLVVHLAQGVVILLHGVPIKVSLVQFRVTQRQPLFQGGNGAVQALLQKVRIHAALLHGFGKASGALNGFFRHGAIRQCHFLQNSVVYTRLVAHTVVQLLPAGVHPLFHPLVQSVNTGHKHVV